MKLSKWLRWTTAVATLLICAALCWQCIDIYLTGTAPEALDASGLTVSQIYRMEDVAARLSKLIWPALAYMALICITIVLDHLKPSIKQAERRSNISYRRIKNHFQERHILLIRAMLYVLAVVFIVLGVMNGGLRDVLVKAINICTECIGLG